MRQTIMAPHPVCTCGHLRSAHRIDLSRKTCETTGCPCRCYGDGGTETVVRIVAEPDEDPDVLGRLERLHLHVARLEAELLGETLAGTTRACACGQERLVVGQAALRRGRLHGLALCEGDTDARL